MFTIRPEHIKRVSLATKLFPKLRSTVGIKITKSSDVDFDGEAFCGGRSKNKDLLLHCGFLSESRSGASSFVQLPLFRRCLKKLTDLVEEELENVGARQILFPTLIAQDLWEKSNRLGRQKDALDHVYKFNDNDDNKFLLGPTYEESAAQLFANLETITESELPLLLYQTSPKFRYEPNPKFGLIRCNEFTMNDLYSFDATIEKAKQTYDSISNVYERIFNRLGLNCFRFESGTGGIGGICSHEYQLPVSSGEDTLIKCNSCEHSYNSELDIKNNSGNLEQCIKCNSNNIEKVQALELGHTFLLSTTYSRSMNVRIVLKPGTKTYVEMGSYGLGLTRILGAGLDLFSVVPSNLDGCPDFIQMRWPSGTEPFRVGIVPPARRSQQYNNGSTVFIDRIVKRILESTHSIDLIIEDRDKEGIRPRLERLQSLGIPYIIVVGNRFLQDNPEVEVLQLNSNKKEYKQSYLTEDQVCDFIKRIEQ